MFLAEIVAGLAAGSASLQADALDFLADAGNYGISLFVVGMALRYRAMAALTKGATMGVFGLWVIGVIAWHAFNGTLPHAMTMGMVGLAALLANAAVFGLLWAYRGGDANMRSVWLCSRNDVIGKPRGAPGGARRVRHRHGLAGRGRCRRHGGLGPPGGGRVDPHGFERVARGSRRCHGGGIGIAETVRSIVVTGAQNWYLSE